MAVTYFLLVIILILLVILVYLVYRASQERAVRPEDIENAVSGTWVKLGLEGRVGALETYAKDIRDSYRSLEQMLRVPKERGAFGEITLEVILED